MKKYSKYHHGKHFIRGRKTSTPGWDPNATK